MIKLQTKEMGVIARSGPFLPARWFPVHLVEWRQNRAVGGWMLVMGRWLAEASFLLRSLMAASRRLKTSGKDLSRAQACLCPRCCLDLHLLLPRDHSAPDHSVPYILAEHPSLWFPEQELQAPRI